MLPGQVLTMSFPFSLGTDLSSLVEIHLLITKFQASQPWGTQMSCRACPTVVGQTVTLGADRRPNLAPPLLQPP